MLGCHSRSGYRQNWNGAYSDRRVHASYDEYDGSERDPFRLSAAGPILVNYQARVSKGSLTLRIEDPDGKTAFSQNLSADTPATEVIVPGPKAGDYAMVIEGHKTAGSFDVSFAPK
jgi:hypothetical protein